MFSFFCKAVIIYNSNLYLPGVQVDFEDARKNFQELVAAVDRARERLKLLGLLLPSNIPPAIGEVPAIHPHLP
jgi:hypothetical protein